MRAIAILAVLCCAGLAHAAPAESPMDALMYDEFGRSRLWNLDVPRNELEPVIAEFMNSYNAGDARRTAALFARDVVTDQGKRTVAQLREYYEEHYLGTLARYLNLRNARWQQDGERVMAEVDFSMREQSRLDGKDRDYAGAIRFYLEKDTRSARWLISELYFAYDLPSDIRLHPKKR